MSSAELDPYSAKAQNNKVTPQKKIDDLKNIIMKTVKTGMLTSRDSSGNMHSRAMTPAGPASDTQLTLVFIANNSSQKFSELEQDSHVNVSFYDEKSTSWASFSGQAKLSRDKALIHKYWNNMIAGYFGDLGDGVHKGDEDDPRVTVIEVVPDEIHYFLATEGAVRRAVSEALGAVTGDVVTPGELRTISKSEIQLTQGLHST